MQDHWLARDSSIRLLWRGFIVVLALTVLAEFFVSQHPHFRVESVPGFGAWYGFLACAGLILFAKGLAMFLKRPDTYYEKGERDG
ncbi:MAG: hypothetical protein O2979_12125 [Proteobacteria bacterium]|nr:hypothetical protein [Pseudomonadota bacterium]